MSFFLIALGVLILLLLPTAYAAKIGAPYAPTFNAAIEQAFDYIKLDSTDTLVDLGAGDGRVLIAAHKRGATAVGYELSPIMWVITYLRTKLGRIRRQSKIFLKNFYTQKLPATTTVVFAFLMPENMFKVKDLLAKQTLPQAKYLLAYAFPLPKVVPLHVVRAKRCAPLYIYNLKEFIKS